MTDNALVLSWDAPESVLPNSPQPDVVYVLPAWRSLDGKPAYKTDSLLLVKTARADGIAIEFAKDVDERIFIEEFSAETTVIDIWLALTGPITDVFLFGLGYMISALGKRRGHTEDAVEVLPLKLKIAQYDPETGECKGLKIEGNGVDVLAALRELKKGA